MTTTIDPKAPSAPDPGVAEAAQLAFGGSEGGGASAPPPTPTRGPGAPKGTVPWNKGRKRGAPAKAAPRAPEEDALPSGEEVLAVGLMTGTLWRILEPRVGLDPLSPEESEALAGAVAAVLKKYLPSYGAYAVEAQLALVLVTLIATKYRGKPKLVEGGPELELGPAPSGKGGADAERERIAERFAR